MKKLPLYEHDCAECVYLGSTIGGGKMFDLYAHENKGYTVEARATLIARFGPGGDYFSTFVGHARPEGHAELFAARALYERHLGEKSC